MERELAATRTGAGTSKGAAAQVEVTGIIAAAYDHWDSSAADLHLHTHVVVSNKVRTVYDGKWPDSHRSSAACLKWFGGWPS